MAREVKIYSGGKSGWVENLSNGNSVHFVVYNDKIPLKKAELKLGWDTKPKAVMSKIAKDKVFEYFKGKKKGDWHSTVK